MSSVRDGLPPAVDVDVAALKARHDLHGNVQRLGGGGIFNTIYAVGESLILRVPRNDPFFVETARKEMLAVPAARAAGVRTPAIVAADLSCEIVPVPYAIYERVDGESLERAVLDPAEHPHVWRELGRDLARLHHGVAEVGTVGRLEAERLPDARTLLDETARSGHISVVEERWLSVWLDELETAGAAAAERHFLHGDVQSSNLMAKAAGAEMLYAAVIDWGGCGWGDPADDFAGLPLRAVPAMLEGYRDALTVAPDDSFRARIVRRQLQLALFNLRRGGQPGLSWAERPATMLIDILRFFVHAPPAWRAVGPPDRLPLQRGAG